MDSVTINRAPVLTLWAPVVAEWQGFKHDEFPVALLGRSVHVLHADEGLRAVGKDQKVIEPASVEKCLKSKYGEALPAGDSGCGKSR
jgi:hypothetical protein